MIPLKLQSPLSSGKWSLKMSRRLEQITRASLCERMEGQARALHLAIVHKKVQGFGRPSASVRLRLT